MAIVVADLWVSQMDFFGILTVALAVEVVNGFFHLAIVEFDESQLSTVRGEPRSGVSSQHFLLVHPVGDSVVNHARFAVAGDDRRNAEIVEAVVENVVVFDVRKSVAVGGEESDLNLVAVGDLELGLALVRPNDGKLRDGRVAELQAEEKREIIRIVPHKDKQKEDLVPLLKF